MANINLHQAAENDLRINKRKSVIKSGPFISMVLLSVVLVIYGMTTLYKKTLVMKKNDLIATKEAEMKSFDPALVNELADFDYRLDNIEFNLENKKDPEKIFGWVESYIVKGAFLNSMSYDSEENKLEMEVVADSFRLAANQILSLKKSELFSDVQVLDSGRNQSKQAVFKLGAYFKEDLGSDIETK